MKSNYTILALILLLFYPHFNFCIINALRRTPVRIPVKIAFAIPSHVKNRINPHLEHLHFEPDLLEKADKYLGYTPGYDKVIRDITRTYMTNTSFLKGFLFELEKTIALIEQGETIEALHQDIYDPLSETLRDKKEVDILTSKKAIECKYYNWKSILTENKYHVPNQLFSQRCVIEAHNLYYKKAYEVCLCSKTPIADWMKMWLDEHNFSYEDPLSSAHSSCS